MRFVCSKFSELFVEAHSSGKLFLVCPHIENISLATDEEIYEVAEIASGGF